MLFCFFSHAVVGRPIKKLFCETNVDFELNDGGDERELKFEHSESLGERKTIVILPCVFDIECPKTSDWAERFFHLLT